MPLILSLGVVGFAAWYLGDKNVMIFNPKGSIAQEQYDLIVFTLLLSLVIIIPVFALTFYIVWKYRASNTKAKYSPDMDGSRVAETIWWIIPLVLITILSVLIWKSSHQLDPYKPLQSNKKPLTVQVVALQWKWLFIYPEQGLATINDLKIPEDRPINFQITADAPMNSFWIPQLGGQVYAMSGMSTKLHLLANEPGKYQGMSANLSGAGFADMKFVAHAMTGPDFATWAKSTSSKPLDQQEYDRLAKPSNDSAPTLYLLSEKQLYDNVIKKYMDPAHAKNKDGNKTQETEHGH